VADSWTRAKNASRTICANGADGFFARNGARRSFSVRQAARAASPFRSVPLEAAVGEVFGTLPVEVGMRRTLPSGTPSSLATICATLVISPWPISVPPWFSCTLPSV
jgi:hypothetical protein